MNGSKLIQFYVRRTELSDTHHLRELLIANECFVYFEDGLLEDEIDRISEDFLRV